MKLTDIKIGKRFRKDLGDIDALAASIERLGQLQDIVVGPDGQLIAGYRRVKAVQQLGWKTIRAYKATNLDDAIDRLLAERDENTERKAPNPSEAVSIGEAIAKAYKPVAEKAQKKAGGRGKEGGRGKKKTLPVTCGKGKRQARERETSAQAAKAAGMSQRTYEKAKAVKDSGNAELVAEMDQTGKVDKAHKKLQQSTKAKEDRKAAARAKRSITKSDEDGVYHGNSFELANEVPDASCALVFTDPPYDRDSLHQFADLGALAGRILVDGGSLITYCGQYAMPSVLDLVLKQSSLRFFWIACCLHTGGVAQMREYGIKVQWKPMLWFVKGAFRRDRETWVDDLVESREEKDSHPWQQSVLEARYYIEKLTTKTELVVDPFCGGGTTAIAAKQLGRQWWTADIEAAHVQTARERLR